eukprot:6027258-Ditylum_brightwellii.AAC.1
MEDFVMDYTKFRAGYETFHMSSCDKLEPETVIKEFKKFIEEQYFEYSSITFDCTPSPAEAKSTIVQIDS